MIQISWAGFGRNADVFRGSGGLKLLDSECRPLVSFGNFGFGTLLDDFGCFRALRITIGLITGVYLFGGLAFAYLLASLL